MTEGMIRKLWRAGVLAAHEVYEECAKLTTIEPAYAMAFDITGLTFADAQPRSR